MFYGGYGCGLGIGNSWGYSPMMSCYPSYGMGSCGMGYLNSMCGGYGYYNPMGSMMGGYTGSMVGGGLGTLLGGLAGFGMGGVWGAVPGAMIGNALGSFVGWGLGASLGGGGYNSWCY
jgi:hypothetical protein